MEGRSRWERPPEGWVKANVDGSFVHDIGAASAGIVICDHNVAVLLTSWRNVSHCGSAEEAEVSACQEGVHLAVEWVKQPLILETDCASLVKMMASPDFERAHLCHTLRSIKSLSAVLLGFRIQKVKRECNSVAHELAKLAMHTNHSVVWRMQAPSCLAGLQEIDCNQTNG